jgi:hypothetical protein
VTHVAPAFAHQSLRTRLICAPGAAAGLGDELSKLGCRRPLLLSGARTAAGALYAEARHALRDLTFFEANDIAQHSSVPLVNRIAALARANAIDALVAVGGGSVSDTAKAVALVLAEGDPLEKHATTFVPPDTVLTPQLLRAKLPIVSIPTTASGAEVTPSFGIRTAQGGKLLFWDARLASRVILLDPVANVAMPAAVMLATGLNGLAHCIEGLYSRMCSPIASALAIEAIARFDGALRDVARSPDLVAARAPHVGDGAGQRAQLPASRDLPCAGRDIQCASRRGQRGDPAACGALQCALRVGGADGGGAPSRPCRRGRGGRRCAGRLDLRDSARYRRADPVARSRHRARGAAPGRRKNNA